jgi:hypothetical protein
VQPFIVPIIKASTRDTTRLEALACNWLAAERGWQVTAVWSNEAMPPGYYVKDKLYKAVRLLRCARRKMERRRCVAVIVVRLCAGTVVDCIACGAPAQVRPPARHRDLRPLPGRAGGAARVERVVRARAASAVRASARTQTLPHRNPEGTDANRRQLTHSFPSGYAPVRLTHTLRFPGTFSHTSTFAVNKHFSARIPGELLSYERGRPVLYSRTWNHLSHFRPETGADGRALPHVSYDALPAARASRADVERRFSVLLPWKAAESGGARKSFAHTILFEPPELSTDEVLDEESEREEAAQAAQAAQGAAAQGGAAAGGAPEDAHGGGGDGRGGGEPRRAGGGGGKGGAGGGAGAPPARAARRKRGARVRSVFDRAHRWLWGLGG